MPPRRTVGRRPQACARQRRLADALGPAAMIEKGPDALQSANFSIAKNTRTPAPLTMSGLPQPQLHKDAKYIFLSDWVSCAAHCASGLQRRIAGTGPKLTEQPPDARRAGHVLSSRRRCADIPG